MYLTKNGFLILTNNVKNVNSFTCNIDLKIFILYNLKQEVRFMSENIDDILELAEDTEEFYDYILLISKIMSEGENNNG